MDYLRVGWKLWVFCRLFASFLSSVSVLILLNISGLNWLLPSETVVFILPMIDVICLRIACYPDSQKCYFDKGHRLWHHQCRQWRYRTEYLKGPNHELRYWWRQSIPKSCHRWPLFAFSGTTNPRSTSGLIRRFRSLQVWLKATCGIPRQRPWRNPSKLRHNTCAEISRKSISWFNIFIMDRVNYERLLPLLFQNIGQ